MTLRDLQPDALAQLDVVLARAQQVTDPRLLEVALACIECHVAGGPNPPEPANPTQAAVQAVVEQMLVDVASLQDSTVQGASNLLPDGALADLVMASYANEAAARLRVASERLLGGLS